MQIYIVGYNEVFNNDVSFVYKELNEYETSELIIMCSFISTSLYFNINAGIIRKIFERAQSLPDGARIHKKTNGSFHRIISAASIPLVLQTIMENSHEGQSHDENSNFVMLTKLFLIANSKLIKPIVKQQLESINEKSDFSFQRIYWPILISQVDVNSKTNFISEVCKNAVLLKYIETNDGDGLKAYLSSIGFTNRFSYGNFFINYFFQKHDDIKNSRCPYWIVPVEKIKPYFDSLSINYATEYSIKNLKQHPLYYHKGKYYIMDWNYFGAQIYIGTLMNIKGFLQKMDQNNLKHMMGNQIESTLFKYVLKACFAKIAQRIVFDCDYLTEKGGSKGYPDCIMKSGNNIFFFEFKDNLMGEESMSSQDYDNYSNKIITIFVNKGANQLANNIEKYVSGLYSSDRNKDLRMAYAPHYNIYPILVYTDYKYEVQGVNDFINQKFQTLIDAKQFEPITRNRIKPLVFINLNFFLNHIHAFNTKTIELHQLIHEYNDNILGQVNAHNEYLKQNNSDIGVPHLFSSLYMPFEKECGVADTVIPTKDNAPYIDNFLKGLC